MDRYKDYVARTQQDRIMLDMLLMLESIDAQLKNTKPKTTTRSTSTATKATTTKAAVEKTKSATKATTTPKRPSKTKGDK
jgi:hypothetical protein